MATRRRKRTAPLTHREPFAPILEDTSLQYGSWPAALSSKLRKREKVDLLGRIHKSRVDEGRLDEAAAIMTALHRARSELTASTMLGGLSGGYSGAAAVLGGVLLFSITQGAPLPPVGSLALAVGLAALLAAVLGAYIARR